VCPTSCTEVLTIRQRDCASLGLFIRQRKVDSTHDVPPRSPRPSTPQSYTPCAEVEMSTVVTPSIRVTGGRSIGRNASSSRSARYRRRGA
jgi:hypothetical protein